jgi:hypothetical protein
VYSLNILALWWYEQSCLLSCNLAFLPIIGRLRRVVQIDAVLAPPERCFCLRTMLLSILVGKLLILTQQNYNAGAQEGHPLASNNGVERDGETQRLTVHCAHKDCKKRQCKAIRLSFNASVPTSEVVLKRIMALMQVINFWSYFRWHCLPNCFCCEGLSACRLIVLAFRLLAAGDECVHGKESGHPPPRP